MLALSLALSGCLTAPPPNEANPSGRVLAAQGQSTYSSPASVCDGSTCHAFLPFLRNGNFTIGRDAENATLVAEWTADLGEPTTWTVHVTLRHGGTWAYETGSSPLTAYLANPLPAGTYDIRFFPEPGLWASPVNVTASWSVTYTVFG